MHKAKKLRLDRAKAFRQWLYDNTRRLIYAIPTPICLKPKKSLDCSVIDPTPTTEMGMLVLGPYYYKKGTNPKQKEGYYGNVIQFTPNESSIHIRLVPIERLER